MATAADRQVRRLTRMAERGIKRTTVMVHEACKPALDEMRQLLVDDRQAIALREAVTKLAAAIQPVNVSQVQQLSPFRYPGGKTWCVPEVRRWLSSLPKRPRVFVEPFAGGGIVSLTVAVEDLADRVIMGELDADVAAVWHVLLGEDELAFERLCREVLTFTVTRENVLDRFAARPTTLGERAFQTILKNRVNRGGILAPGASLQKNGENGKGIASRWYPETLVRRFRTIRSVRHKLSFFEKDAFAVIAKHSKTKSAAFFIDPPYTAGGKNAGSRLYIHNEIDHPALFDAMASIKGEFLMTYDESDEVRRLVAARGLIANRVPMKSTHHAVHHELLISGA